MGKKLGKSVFTTGVAATTVLSGMFHHKASAEEVKQNENAETNSTEVVEKPITVDELKQITAQKGQVVKDVHYQEQKSDRCSNGSQGRWTRVGRKES